MKKNFLFTLLAALTIIFAFAQEPFEGTLTVNYKSEKGENTVADIKIKDHRVYIKQTQNGNKKYSGFLINLTSRELFAISTADKKVVIKYNLDKLLAFYEQQKLKDNYQQKHEYTFKVSDKTKDEGGNRLTRVMGENDYHKITLWVTGLKIPLNELIPFLRLIGNWNEAEYNIPAQTVMEAEASSKLIKKETTVKVIAKREVLPKGTFDLPKDYTVNDFSKLMEEQQGNKDLKAIIQTFAEF